MCKVRHESFRCRTTAYYPTPDGTSTPENRREGGPVDREGRPLHSLQEYLEGRAPYVSVAMDSDAFPYGTVVMIPELDLYCGKPIEFRVVDTGGAFDQPGRQLGRMDICVRSEKDSWSATVNRIYYMVALTLDITPEAAAHGHG